MRLSFIGVFIMWTLEVRIYIAFLQQIAYDKDKQEAKYNCDGLLGGIFIATTSIFANVRITDPKKAEVFAEMLDESVRDPERVPSASVIPLVTNIDEIQKFMMVGIGEDE